MSNFNVEMKGLDKILKDLTKKGKNIRPAVRKATLSTTNKCKKLAKEKAPADTGLLRNSIHSEVKDSTDGFTGEVSTNLEYAPYVEYGTGQKGKESNTNSEIEVSYKADWKGQKAQPFMYPAYLEAREELKPKLEKELKKILKEG